MHDGKTAPNLSVVHAGQIVEEQGAGVDELHGAGGRKGGSNVRAKDASPQDGENRTDPLAARKDSVPQGIIQEFGFAPAALWELLGQGGFNSLVKLFHGVTQGKLPRVAARLDKTYTAMNRKAKGISQLALRFGFKVI